MSKIILIFVGIARLTAEGCAHSITIQQRTRKTIALKRSLTSAISRWVAYGVPAFSYMPGQRNFRRDLTLVATGESYWSQRKPWKCTSARSVVTSSFLHSATETSEHP